MESDIKFSTNNSPPEVGFAENCYIMCFFFVYSVPRLQFGNIDQMKRLRETRKHAGHADGVATGEEDYILHTQGTKKERKAKETMGKAF